MAKIGGPDFYMLPIFTKNAGKNAGTNSDTEITINLRKINVFKKFKKLLKDNSNLYKIKVKLRWYSVAFLLFF